MAGNEFFQFTLESASLTLSSREKKYRGSQSANTTVVVENLTLKLKPWDEEMGQRPMNVSEFKVCGLYLFFFT